MRRLLFFFLLLLGAGNAVRAQQAASAADSAYLAKDYAAAVQHYERAIAQRPTATLYFNLGNAQYRRQEWAEAVLAYERALHLDPAHADAQFNLELVRTKLTDRFAAPSQMFFVSALNRLIESQRVQTWTLWSFIMLLGVGIGWAVFALAPHVMARKMGFFFGLCTGLAFVVFTLFAFVQRRNFEGNSRAVVMTEQCATYQSATTNSQQGPMLREGTTIEVEEAAGARWSRVALPDGRRFWLENANFRRIVTKMQQ